MYTTKKAEKGTMLREREIEREKWEQTTQKMKQGARHTVYMTINHKRTQSIDIFPVVFWNFSVWFDEGIIVKILHRQYFKLLCSLC